MTTTTTSFKKQFVLQNGKQKQKKKAHVTDLSMFRLEKDILLTRFRDLHTMDRSLHWAISRTKPAFR